jgi:endo-1,4-beta-xylanase
MRISRRDCLVLGGGAALAAASGAAAQTPSLDALAQAKGVRFGTAVGVGRPGAGAFHDADYRELVAQQSGIIVAENEMKLYALKGATAEQWNWEPADTLARFAKERGLLFRGHTLLWNRDEFAPNWIKAHDFGGRANAEKWLTSYISTLAGRYRGQIESWDVVNETIDPKTGAMRDTVFTRAMGPEVVELAFHVAKQAAPEAKLLYNDYMGHAAVDAKHRAGVLKLLERLKSRNAPIDALGVQGHIANGDSDPAIRFDGQEARDWRAFMDEVKGMGLDVLITEFDVNDTAGPADPAQRDKLIAGVTRDYLDMMLSYPELKQVLAWGLADRHSWLQTWWPRPDKLPKRPTPYDADLKPKAMREAVAAAFRAAPPRQGWS